MVWSRHAVPNRLPSADRNFENDEVGKLLSKQNMQFAADHLFDTTRGITNHLAEGFIADGYTVCSKSQNNHLTPENWLSSKLCNNFGESNFEQCEEADS